MTPRVLNVVLSHQPPPELGRTISIWHSFCDAENLLVAFGGKRSDFDAVRFQQKVFVADPRLRTRNHQRELQSLTGLFKTVADWMRESPTSYDFVYFAEFDHLPLVVDLSARQMALAEHEDADLLGHHVARIDGTNHPHYLHHASFLEFHGFFERLSCRADSQTILSMLGTGSFWRAETFLAVASVDETVSMYQELYVPTVAHHLGFRVRDYGQQSAFVSAADDHSDEIEAARACGAWTLHPVKRLPSDFYVTG